MSEEPTLHYRPTDGWFGDAIPFYWDGVYHVFYDKLRDSGGICWAHVASRDLVRWDECPDAIVTGDAGSVDCDCCITGSVLERDGVFHAFYSAMGAMGAVICHATSADLLTWEKDAANPILVRDARWYADENTWRDPCVIWNEAEGLYWMLITARLKPQAGHAYRGCLALAKSYDLREWTVCPPFWTPGYCTAPECSDLFRLGEAWALVHFWHETRVRIADQPAGPFKRVGGHSPDSFGLFAGKTMFDGSRRILVGWLPRQSCDCAARTWGGHMLLPRELYLGEDGVPATRLVPEVPSALSDDATVGRDAGAFTPVTGDWRMDGRVLSTDPGPGHSALASWKDAPHDFYLRANVRLGDGASAAILLRTGADDENPLLGGTDVDKGYALWLDPAEMAVTLRRWYVWDQAPPLASLSCDMLGQPFVLEIVVDGDILEVFIDGRRSLVSRLTERSGHGLSVLVQDGELQMAIEQCSTLK